MIIQFDNMIWEVLNTADDVNNETYCELRSVHKGYTIEGWVPNRNLQRARTN